MSHHRSGAAEIDALQDDMDHLQVADAHHPEYVSGDRDGGSSLGSSELEEDDDDDDDVEDDDDAGAEEGSEEETSWIAWFCSLRENDFLCEVDEEYIEDDFNLTGLNTFVPYYDYALDLILDMETPHDQNLTQIQQEMIESAAEMLYGLIHSRYILTTKGMAAMLEKYQNVDFGRCHRVHCQGQPVLPVGQSDVPRHTTVNVFCPKCRDIYFPKSQRAGQIDGAYFGTTFPHVFLMTHSQLVPPPPTQVYVPKIYGFKVHESSEYYTGKKKTSSSSPDRNNSRRGRKRFDRLLRA